MPKVPVAVQTSFPEIVGLPFRARVGAMRWSPNGKPGGRSPIDSAVSSHYTGE
jgi:hypothetical protein